MYRYPYLSFDCDAHYSPIGADIYSDFIKETFLKLLRINFNSKKNIYI